MRTQTTDFALYLQGFFSDYLPGERMVSKHTIRAYRDSFVLFLEYIKFHKKMSPDKLRLEDFTKEAIVSYLDWLKESKQCGDSTRAARYAAICSFCKYLQYKDPTRLAQWQAIRSLRIKKPQKVSVAYLSIKATKAILEQIPVESRTGLRNFAMLSLLYESAARVQELINLTPSCIRTESPSIIYLHGKGGKKRVIPIGPQIVEILSTYMKNFGLDNQHCRDRPLFFNSWGVKLTSSGVTYILKKYASMARVQNPNDIPSRISPHCLRHSRAMHLLQQGVNLVYIRDILGHVSIQTTEIYARVDSKQKREAIEKASQGIIDTPIGIPIWEKDEQLKAFLKSLA